MLGRIGRAAKFIGTQAMEHPLAMLGAGAAYGVYKAHPWRKVAGVGALVGLPVEPFSRGSIMSSMFLGDPDAVATITHASITKGIMDTIGAGGSQNQAIPSRSPNYGPDGSMVFGLYNTRLK